MRGFYQPLSRWPLPVGAGKAFQRGFTAAETSIAMGIVGVLAAIGVSTADFGNQELTTIQCEFQASLQQAFLLAHDQGRDVIVALGNPAAPGILPVRMPPHVKWGKPDDVPMPPGMAPTKKAAATGQAHARITVTPRRTATASAWFVNDGKDVVCMRVSGLGHIQVLRWRKRMKKWSLC